MMRGKEEEEAAGGGRSLQIFQNESPGRKCSERRYRTYFQRKFTLMHTDKQQSECDTIHIDISMRAMSCD